MREIRINPSSSAFMVGELVKTEAQSGCLRHLLLKNYLPIEDKVPEELQKMGAWGEDMYQEFLENHQEWPFHKELVMKTTLDDVTVSGRIDFVTYHDGYRVIHECKTSQSKNILYKTINKGELKLNHLAQLVFYLIHMNETRGKLVIRYAPKNTLRIFRITIGDDGEIFVDGDKHEMTVQDQLRHQLMSAHVIKEKELLARPESPWACKYCVYNKLCDKYDAEPKSFNEFVEENKEIT